MVIDDKNFVGKEQHEIAIVVRTLQLLLDLLELERQIITEGTEQADARILFAVEEVGNRPHDGKHRRRPGTHFLGFDFSAIPDPKADGILALFERSDVVMVGKNPADLRQQYLAAIIVGEDADIPSVRLNSQRRIDDGGIPSGVAPRIFVVGGKHRTAPPVDALQHVLDGRGIVGLHAGARNANTAFCYIFDRTRNHLVLSRFSVSTPVGQTGHRQTKSRPDGYPAASTHDALRSNGPAALANLPPPAICDHDVHVR